MVLLLLLLLLLLLQVATVKRGLPVRRDCKDEALPDAHRVALLLCNKATRNSTEFWPNAIGAARIFLSTHSAVVRRQTHSPSFRASAWLQPTAARVLTLPCRVAPHQLPPRPRPRSRCPSPASSALGPPRDTLRAVHMI